MDRQRQNLIVGDRDRSVSSPLDHRLLVLGMPTLDHLAAPRMLSMISDLAMIPIGPNAITHSGPITSSYAPTPSCQRRRSLCQRSSMSSSLQNALVRNAGHQRLVQDGRTMRGVLLTNNPAALGKSRLQPERPEWGASLPVSIRPHCRRLHPRGKMLEAAIIDGM